MKKQNQLKAMAFAAVLAAVSVALGFFSIRVGDVYKFGFSKLPVVLAGMVLGPLWGALVGAVGDIIAAIPLGWNPLFTLPALFVGSLPWCFTKLLGGKNKFFSVVVSTVISRVLMSGFLLTVLLGYVYGWFEPITKFNTMLSVRLVTAFVESIVEGVAIYFIINAKGIDRIIKKNHIEL